MCVFTLHTLTQSSLAHQHLLKKCFSYCFITPSFNLLSTIFCILQIPQRLRETLLLVSSFQLHTVCGHANLTHLSFVFSQHVTDANPPCAFWYLLILSFFNPSSSVRVSPHCLLRHVFTCLPDPLKYIVSTGWVYSFERSISRCTHLRHKSSFGSLLYLNNRCKYIFVK